MESKNTLGDLESNDGGGAEHDEDQLQAVAGAGPAPLLLNHLEEGHMYIYNSLRFLLDVYCLLCNAL